MDDDTFSQDDPVYWRQQAADASAQADAIHDQELKGLMRGVAVGYERIADWLERQKIRSASC